MNLNPIKMNCQFSLSLFLVLLFGFISIYEDILFAESLQQKEAILPAKCDSQDENWQEMSEQDWKLKMSPEQFLVSRKGGTERPFSGKYYQDQRAGTYHCSSCGQPLFSSETKFDSGTGWPSFTDPVNTKNLKLVPDNSKGMQRTEVLCARCNAHLGHVFNDGPSESGNRFCINSLSLVHELDKND